MLRETTFCFRTTLVFALALEHDFGVVGTGNDDSDTSGSEFQLEPRLDGLFGGEGAAGDKRYVNVSVDVSVCYFCYFWIRHPSTQGGGGEHCLYNRCKSGKERDHPGALYFGASAETPQSGARAPTAESDISPTVARSFLFFLFPPGGGVRNKRQLPRVGPRERGYRTITVARSRGRGGLSGGLPITEFDSK